MRKFLPLLMLLTFLLCGCGDEPVQKPPPQITIAIQDLPNDESIARDWYKTEFGELGYKVIVLEYESSGLVSNAMASGNVDIGVIGTSAAVNCISKGLPFEVFWIHNIEGDNECLVVKNTSGINSIAELKGKRVGVPPDSTALYSLLHSIKKAGLSTGDVTIMTMQPSAIVKAWKDGKIDAAFLWQPTLGELFADGHILVSARELDAMGITSADVGVVNKDFARKHPAVLKKYVEMQIRAHELFRNQPIQAAEIAAKNLGMSPSDALKQMNELVWIDVDEQISERYFGTDEWRGNFARTLEETAYFLAHNMYIAHVVDSEVFAKAINSSFVEAVLKN